MARSDMSDLEWEFIRAVLPNKTRGKKRADDRRVINGIFYVRRALVWGLGLPVGTVLLVLAFGPWGLAALLAYPMQIARVALREGAGQRFSWSFAGAMVLGKFAEMSGILRYARRYAGGRRSRIIEYK